jgi:hypothetical protein
MTNGTRKVLWWCGLVLLIVVIAVVYHFLAITVYRLLKPTMEAQKASIVARILVMFNYPIFECIVLALSIFWYVEKTQKFRRKINADSDQHYIACRKEDQFTMKVVTGSILNPDWNGSADPENQKNLAQLKRDLEEQQLY